MDLAYDGAWNAVPLDRGSPDPSPGTEILVETGELQIMPAMPAPQLCNLEAALRRMGGNVVLLKQVIGFFHADVPGLRARIRQGLAAGDGQQVQIAAHSLKGLASNFDAERAVKAALRVEQLGQAGRLEEAAVSAEDLDRELDELSISLDAESARLGN